MRLSAYICLRWSGSFRRSTSRFIPYRDRPLFHVRKDAIMDEICTIGGCEKPVNAKGLCAMHYARQRRKKTPTVSKAEGRLEELGAMKAVLARAIDDPSTPPRALPALVRRHIEVSELLEDLEEREDRKSTR